MRHEMSGVPRFNEFRPQINPAHKPTETLKQFGVDFSKEKKVGANPLDDFRILMQEVRNLPAILHKDGRPYTPESRKKAEENMEQTITNIMQDVENGKYEKILSWQNMLKDQGTVRTMKNTIPSMNKINERYMDILKRLIEKTLQDRNK
jgi:hypothetical protein